MALCRLTLNWGEGQPVWINPANVISVWAQGEGAVVTTTGNNGDRAHSIYVTETAERAAITIDEAMR